ncbi:MAG: hypothetical protein P0120_21795 [Nitrospira sp.]|nr:hypothetical protein [Nitrospira sp.]
MSDALLAQLKRIGLTQIPPDAVHPQARWAFEATAGLFDFAGNPSGLADLRLGIGNAPNADQVLGATQTDGSPGLVQGLSEAKGLWLGFGIDAALNDGVPDRPVWLAVITSQGLDLLGAHPIPPPAQGEPALDTGGLLEFSNLLLRVRLRAAGAAVERCEISIEGEATLRADFGPFRLTDPNHPLTAGFKLGIAGALPADLGVVLRNPSAILDQSFRGELSLKYETNRPIPFAGANLTGTHHIEFRIQVTSPSRSRALSLDQVTYTHASSGSVTVGGAAAVRFDALRLRAEVMHWSKGVASAIDFSGEADVALPPAVQNMMAGSGSGHALIQLHHEGAGLAEAFHFGIALDQLELKPEANPLALGSADLKLTLSHTGSGPWTIAFSADLRQSWTRLAQTLRERRIVSLPPDAGFPDFESSFALRLAGNSWSIRLALLLAEPGSTAPYNGPLGPLPLQAGSVSIELTGAQNGSQWQWTAQGTAKITTRGELQQLAPVQNLPVSVRLSTPSDASQIPELEFTAAAGLPPLKLPPLHRVGPRLDLFRLDRLTLALGTGFRFESDVSLLPNLSNVARRVGLPDPLRSLLDPLIGTVQGTVGKLMLNLPLAAGDALHGDLLLTPGPDVQPLDLFRIFAGMVPGTPHAAAADPSASVAVNPLLLITPSQVRFVVDVPPGGEPNTRFLASILCNVYGETFDAVLTITVSGSDVEISLLVGVADPIVIRIPSSGTTLLAAGIDQSVNNVLDLYQLRTNSPAAQQLRSTAAQIKAVLSSQESDVLFAFEFTNMGITLRLSGRANPLTIAGGLRLVQYPSLLDAIFTGPPPELIVGSSGTSVFIELRPVPVGSAGTPPAPLIHFPITDVDYIDIRLHALRIGYGWDPPAFELTLRSDVVTPNRPFAGGVGFRLAQGTSPNAAASMDLELQVPAAGAVPIAQWDFDFRGSNPAPDRRGLEFIIGRDNRNRFLTLHLRQTSFSPTLFLLMPGGVLDWGMFFGPPPESRTQKDFYFEFRMGRATMITINPVIGLMMNPFAAIPPFLSATPPFWVIPPIMMGDWFTDETGQTGLELRANIPALCQFEIVLKRPLPSLNLQMFLEIALLVIQEFAVELPANSSLRNLFYAGLSGSLKIPALAAIFGADNANLAAHIEFNMVDVVNGALQLARDVRKVLEDAGQAASRAEQMVADMLEDPSLIVRMIPRNQRAVKFQSHFQALGLSLDCNLSAYLLLPEEVEAELRMFHQDQRKKGKGLASLRDPEPAGPLIDLPPELHSTLNIMREGIFDPRTFVSQGLVARMQRNGEAKLWRRLGPAMEARRQTLIENKAMAAARAADNADPDARHAALTKHNLADTVPAVERVLRSPHLPPPTLGLSQRATAIYRVVRPAIESQKISVEFRHRLGDNVARLAEALASGAVQLSRGGRVELSTTRKDLYRNMLGGIGKVKDDLDSQLDAMMAPLLPSGPLTPGQFSALQKEIARKLAPAIEGFLEILPKREFAPRDLSSIAGSMLASLTRVGINTIPDIHSVSRSSVWFDGNKLRQWFNSRWGGKLPSLGQPQFPNELEESKGFEIRLRKEYEQLAPGFAITVPNQAASFTVKLEGGAWHIVLGTGAGALRTDLPAAVVASVPFGPRRARQLQARFHVAVKRVKRSLTSEERSWQRKDPYETIKGLHKRSIFYSPEYQIRPDGGRRGAFYLADLLRKTNGDYVTLSQPMAMLGFQLSLLKPHSDKGGLQGGLSVRFAGFASPGGQLLAFGAANTTVGFEEFSAKIQGEFHLAVGDVGPVTIPGGPSVEPNSVGFHGVAELRHGSQTMFRGNAAGSLVAADSRSELRLKVATSIDWSHELEVGEVKMLKVSVQSDLTVDVTLGRFLNALLDQKVTVSYAFGTVRTKEVDVEVTLCLLGGCVTFVEGTVEVPDLGHPPEWGEWKTVSGNIFLNLRSGPQPSFSCEVSANIPMPGGGTFEFSADLSSLEAIF